MLFRNKLVNAEETATRVTWRAGIKTGWLG